MGEPSHHTSRPWKKPEDGEKIEEQMRCSRERTMSAEADDIDLYAEKTEPLQTPLDGHRYGSDGSRARPDYSAIQQQEVEPPDENREDGHHMACRVENGRRGGGGCLVAVFPDPFPGHPLP